MQTINIEIIGSYARSPDAEIVCGNSEYFIEFAFSAEWREHRVKTARFIFGDSTVDTVFEGNVVRVPIIRGASVLEVGVYAGNLQTTTPALISCKKSILCKGGAPAEPSEDVYNQIMEKINDGTIKGEQGERGEKGEKGEKGDAGAIKFIGVVSLPTENIDDSAIYLVPIADGAEENRFTEYAYIDGKWETLGAISIQVDHSEYVKFTQMNEALAGKLDIPEGTYKVPCIDGNRKQISWSFSQSPNGLTFALRRENGALDVARATKDAEAVPLGQLNTILNERIGSIETALDEVHAYAQALVGGAK